MPNKTSNIPRINVAGDWTSSLNIKYPVIAVKMNASELQTGAAIDMGSRINTYIKTNDPLQKKNLSK